MTDPNVAPPLFSPANGLSANAQAAVASRTTDTLNLDDIFGDVVFTPDGDTVFLSEEGALNSGEAKVSTMASRQTAGGTFQQVAAGGGLHTTQLVENGKKASAMGLAGAAAPTKSVPFRHVPQASHHLQYAAPKKKKGDRKMSEQQKVERRYVE